MTIIYSNMLDDDCLTLPRIWENIPNTNVIEITPTSEDWEENVNDAISNEEDTIVFCGHGTHYGLLYPNLERGEYLLHENNVNLIRARNIICIWCNASFFTSEHNLHNSLASSMFISNVGEAYDNCIYGYSQRQINETSERFDREINELILNETPLSEWRMILGIHTDENNEIDVFNRQGVYYQD